MCSQGPKEVAGNLVNHKVMRGSSAREADTRLRRRGVWKCLSFCILLRGIITYDQARISFDILFSIFPSTTDCRASGDLFCSLIRRLLTNEHVLLSNSHPGAFRTPPEDRVSWWDKRATGHMASIVHTKRLCEAYHGLPSRKVCVRFRDQINDSKLCT